MTGFVNDYRRFRYKTSSLSLIGGFAAKLWRICGKNFYRNNVSPKVDLSTFNEERDTYPKENELFHIKYMTLC